MHRLAVALLMAFLVPVAVQIQGGIPDVVAAGAQPELVQEGFVFTEGPLGMPDGTLLFSDIRTANRTYRLDAAWKVSVVREQTRGANGLALAKNGDVLAAEGEGRRSSGSMSRDASSRSSRADRPDPSWRRTM